VNKSSTKFQPETVLESLLFQPYNQTMDRQPDNTRPGWLEDLAQADAEIDAGLFVPAEEVHRMLRESITRLEAKAEDRKHEAAFRR
jgi:hypothetical protein